MFLPSGEVSMEDLQGEGSKTNLFPVRQGARGSWAPEVAQKPNTGWGREVSCILGPPVRKSLISIPISTFR